MANNSNLKKEAITEECNFTLDGVYKDCLRIPKEGIRVDHVHYKKRYQPLDRNYAKMYIIGNRKVIFVDEEGNTRVARGYWILDILINKGFKEVKISGPVSEVGGIILDPELRKIWDTLRKFNI